MNEKELIESRNEKVSAMEAIVNLAKAENRVITEEEKAKFDNLQREIADIDNTLSVMEVTNKMELRPVPAIKEEISNEEKDIHTFANLIRNYSNTATELTKGDNGAVIPETIAKKIIDAIEEISPIFARATKYYTQGTLVIPKSDTSTDDITADYATEFTDLTSHSNKLGNISLTGFLVGALTKISKSLLNNNDFKLTNYVIKRMAEKFKAFYEREFIVGTANKISGIKGSYDSTNMKVVLSKKSSITADELIDIQEMVPDAYQKDACWIMSKANRKAIRKLKDNEGNYILNRAFNEKWDYELLGKPVFLTENLTALGTASKETIIYGDLSGLAVKISEELNINVLQELFAAQHALGVVGFTEVDAKVENVQKIAVAVTGTSDT